MEEYSSRSTFTYETLVSLGSSWCILSLQTWSWGKIAERNSGQQGQKPLKQGCFSIFRHSIQVTKFSNILCPMLIGLFLPQSLHLTFTTHLPLFSCSALSPYLLSFPGLGNPILSKPHPQCPKYQGTSITVATIMFTLLACSTPFAYLHLFKLQALRSRVCFLLFIQCLA